MLAASAIEIIGGTPLIALDRIYTGPGRIIAKAEFLLPGGSVKDRAAKAILLAAREDGRLKLLGQGLDVVKHAVDPDPDAEGVLVHLEVNIRRALLHGLQEDQVDRLDNVRLLREKDLPVDELRERVLREIDAFVGDAPQHDDMTMILLRVGEEPCPIRS